MFLWILDGLGWSNLIISQMLSRVSLSYYLYGRPPRREATKEVHGCYAETGNANYLCSSLQWESIVVTAIKWLPWTLQPITKWLLLRVITKSKHPPIMGTAISEWDLHADQNMMPLEASVEIPHGSVKWRIKQYWFLRRAAWRKKQADTGRKFALRPLILPVRMRNYTSVIRLKWLDLSEEFILLQHLCY